MMRTLFFLLLSAAPLFGLEVPETAPESIVTKNVITVTHAADSWIWIEPPEGATLSLDEAKSDTEWVFSGTPGRYRILEFLMNPRKVESKYCVITPGPDCNGPTPDPEPDPDPDPDPDPPPDPEPEPEPDPDPAPLPDTTYDVGPACNAALGDLAAIERESIAQLLASTAKKMLENRFQDVHAAMAQVAGMLKAKNVELGGKLDAFNETYVKTMTAGWTEGKIVTMTEHAAALEEIAAWITGRQFNIRSYSRPETIIDTDKWPLGPPIRVRCEIINGVKTCFDQYNQPIR